MELVGELLSLIVSFSQEIGIVAGIGAVTMTLVGHLLSLHAHKNEMVFGYVRAALHIRALALMLIVVSGGAALLIHFQAGTTDIIFQPGFLFKWLLILILTALYFAELKAEGIKRDAIEGFEGAHWYALFIVHSIAPVATWMMLVAIYSGWVVTFAVIWAAFVWVMRRHSTIAPKTGLGPNPFPAPKQAPVAPKAAPIPPQAPKPAPVQTPKPVVPPAPPPPKPAPVMTVANPIPAAPKTIEVHLNHTMLPMIAELDLPAPSIAKAPAPVQSTFVPAPKPLATVEIVSKPVPDTRMPNLEESGLPALHVMPKRPEDIESSRRGPVVKMSDE